VARKDVPPKIKQKHAADEKHWENQKNVTFEGGDLRRRCGKVGGEAPA